MTDDQAFEWLLDQLKPLTRRIERLEGINEELRRQAMPPSMLYPKRVEFDALESRVAKLEKSDESAKT